MLHPKLQAQITECLDKKTDSDNISRLFKKISEAYHSYEEQIRSLNKEQPANEGASQEA